MTALGLADIRELIGDVRFTEADMLIFGIDFRLVS
jgi:hypothetical protein